jgi:hypothetical protein
VTTELVLPHYAQAPVRPGDELGKIVHSLNGVVLEEIPLVADRNADAGNFFVRALDALVKVFL